MGFSSWYWAASPNSAVLLCCPPPVPLLLLLDPPACCCWLPLLELLLLLVEDNCCCLCSLLLLLPCSSSPPPSAGLTCPRLALLVSLGKVCWLITTSSNLHLEACSQPPHYQRCPAKGVTHRRSQCHKLKVIDFCPDFQFWGVEFLLRCEQHERLRATEVVSLHG